jgi:hypothetical protein
MDWCVLNTPKRQTFITILASYRTVSYIKLLGFAANRTLMVEKSVFYHF